MLQYRGLEYTSREERFILEHFDNSIRELMEVFKNKIYLNKPKINIIFEDEDSNQKLIGLHPDIIFPDYDIDESFFRLLEKEDFYELDSAKWVRFLGEEYYYTSLDLNPEIFCHIKRCFLVMKLDAFEEKQDDEFNVKSPGIQYFKSCINFELINQLKNFWRVESKHYSYRTRLVKHLTNKFDINRFSTEKILELGVDDFLDDEFNGILTVGKINEISSLMYEQAQVNGSIYVFPYDEIEELQANQIVRVEIELSKTVSIKEIRKIRKLLQITSENLHILIDTSGEVRGLGTIINHNYPYYLVVLFKRFLEWEIYYQKQMLMSSNNFKIMLNRYDDEDHKLKFCDYFQKIFPFLKTNMNKMWDIVQSSINQKKGTIIVISNFAESEAMRLKEESIEVKSFKMTDQLITSVSAIDGAILLDPELYCHSFGVILDGLSQNGKILDSARGSRYNSTIKYIDTVKKQFYKGTDAVFLAIIVSEDGMVNFYTNDN